MLAHYNVLHESSNSFYPAFNALWSGVECPRRACATAGLLLNNVKIPRDSCGQPLNAKGKLVFIVAFVGGDFWSTVGSEWSIFCRKRVLCRV